ncbi:amidohydrolase family protein [Opitutus terrae]|uniref:Amidohydrolase n=1 Tax=Opitutus terrae (strain DSM 11246 / JCM 15787 / PB90-1) TaxID=452637 RepID=B1ZNK2_OPITP|nr:amidohydrolase family protein [Opitutus terrae]ACB74436.1 amidohydrolase [Opitutus terrae PB90-1]
MSVREKTLPVEPAPAATQPAHDKEIGWLPDCVYTGDKFETGLAFFADATGRITRFTRESADLSRAKRLPGQAALPGMVNTHAQSWQRVLRGRFELRLRSDRETLGDWTERLALALGRLTADDLYDAARLAFLEMLATGITCVGEAHTLQRAADGAPWPEPHLGARAILRAARDVGVRICLLNGFSNRADFGQPAGSGPARGLTPTAEQFLQESDSLRAHIEKNLPGDEAWLGVTVRGLGTAPLEMMKTVAAYAHAKRLRLHVVLGASAHEAAACVAEYGRTPAVLLGEHGLLDKRFVAVHGVHLSAEDVRAIGAARVTVCACPAAAAQLGEGSLAADQLLATGATFALGTDGPLQSSVLDQARAIELLLRSQSARAVGLRGDLAAALWQMATSAGARSLGAPGGALEVGRPADFFTVNLFDPALVGAAPEQLLAAMVFGVSPRAVREVWVGARQRIGQWRHPAQSGIVARFAELQQRLWSV